MKTINLNNFLRERNPALLSLNERKIRAYASKYGAHFPGEDDPEVFWRAVHKARTAIRSLPLEARAYSKRWLVQYGSEPWDDGDVK